MEVIKLLTGGKTVDAIAKQYSPEGSKKVYYNFGNGIDELEFHRYIVCLKESDFRDIGNIKKEILLDRKDYSLKAVYNKVGLYKDEIGNTRYNLAIETDTNPYATTLVVWEIPNFHYVDVSYKIISGNVEVIGEGLSGIDRNGTKYKSPAPILEIEGDVTISWSGKDKRGDIVGEVLTRTNNVWASKPLDEVK